MTDTAFKATFADWKVIRTRATVQLVFEIPIEQADAAYQALGGMPIAAKEVWCGIARLANPTDDEQPVSRRQSPAEERPGPATSSPTVPAVPVRAEKERRSFDTLPCAQQAGILCGEQAFKVFLFENFNVIWDRVGHDPAAAVREICEVNTRADLKPDNALWSALVLSYRLWQREPEYVG